VIDEVDQKVMGDILTYGWSCIGVFPTADDPGPSFSYTVGLDLNYDHPELVVVGISATPAHQILALAVNRIQDGSTFTAGTYSEEILDNYRAAFLKVEEIHHPIYPLSMATRLQGDEVTALQLLWPDQEGRFPWHPDFNPKFKEHQPMLGSWEGE
jgi:hypothetical protein